jgi:nucleoside-diphosphate-sugar epimerase
VRQILITGGAGFVGFHLAKYHAECGNKVIIFDNFFKSDGKKDLEFDLLLQQRNINMFEVDLTQPIKSLNISEPLDIVYHLAAINGTRLFYEMPYKVAHNNLLMTLNLLNWLEGKKINKLLYSSSSEVYAGADRFNLLKIPTDEFAPVVFPQPTDVRFSYGTSKFMGEFLCFYFGKTLDIPVSVVRYHNIYGPRMGYRHVIPEFIFRLKMRENPFRTYGGKETRAFCFVDDAVQATQLVATTPDCNNEIVHIGNSKEETTIDNLARVMMDIFGEKFDIKECGRRSGSVSRRCPDTSKLKRLTGFEAKVDMKEGLARTINWYIKHFGDMED